MNHPDREQWIPFLFDQAPRETRQQLARHLKECPDCAREIAAWRGSLARLDRWVLPKARSRRAPLFQPALKWALAAALVLGLGVLIGRASARPADLALLRSQIEQSLHSSFQAELDQKLDEVRSFNSNTLAAAEARLAKASTLENQQLWRGFLDVLSQARSEDSRAVQTALHQYDERQSTLVVALRKDLETLASMTDEELRQARMRLVQLAANNGPTE